MGLLTHDILKQPLRDFVIHQIKTPLVNVILALVSQYPDPTKENTILHNTHILLDIQEAFLRRIRNAKYKDVEKQVELWKAIIKLVIDECEHDPDYRYPFYILLEELVRRVNNGDWQLCPEGRPPHWLDTEPLAKDFK